MGAITTNADHDTAPPIGRPRLEPSVETEVHRSIAETVSLRHSIRLLSVCAMCARTITYDTRSYFAVP